MRQCLFVKLCCGRKEGQRISLKSHETRMSIPLMRTIDQSLHLWQCNCIFCVLLQLSFALSTDLYIRVFSFMALSQLSVGRVCSQNAFPPGSFLKTVRRTTQITCGQFPQFVVPFIHAKRAFSWYVVFVRDHTSLPPPPMGH